jgi:hypothetical protein
MRLAVGIRGERLALRAQWGRMAERQSGVGAGECERCLDVSELRRRVRTRAERVGVSE